MPRWLAYALGVIAIGLLLLVCVIFCMKRQMLCFEGMHNPFMTSSKFTFVGVKTSQAQYPDDKLKPG